MEYRAVTKRDPSTDLTHWKYIKREKKNGKWRYYYDKEQLKDDIKDVIGFDEKKALEKAEKDLADAQFRLKSVENTERIKKEQEEYIDKWPGLKKWKDELLGNKKLDPDDPDYEFMKPKVDAFALERQTEQFVGAGKTGSVDQETRKLKQAKRVVAMFKTEYGKTPLGKLERHIVMGKSYLDKLFKKKR